ncbi:hypothetical protein [Clostridium cagae]|uniref:hypothetical protein n=1 Tax=Clostridium cagae TaxID=2080751 RepID=UPI000CF63AEB|nr:hypothetical protein [Clostridium cagae]
MKYPIDVKNFQDTIYNIVGIDSIESGVCDLEGVDSNLVLTSDYAHLPIAALLRTNGGFENELLVQFRFTIDKSEDGLEALEFISWFIRDYARDKTKIQLTPFALSPQTPNGRQLGSTLRFHIDLFVENVHDSLDPVLKEVKQLNKTLSMAIKLYKIKVK